MDNQSDLLFISRLNDCYDQLGNAEKRVADYMRENLEDIPKQSAKTIADNSGSGPATVMRFCKSIGFSGLAELKLSLKRETIVPERLLGMDISKEDSASLIKQKVLAFHIRTVEQMFMEWNEGTLEAAADMIEKANRILVSGKGASRTSAYLFHDSCHLLGLDCRVENDLVDENYCVGTMKPGDVVMAFSYTGRFKATLDLVKYAKERGLNTIVITGVPDSPITKYADICLFTSKAQKKYYFGTQSNTIGDFAIIEVLHTMLAVRKDNLSDINENIYDMISRLRVDE